MKWAELIDQLSVQMGIEPYYFDLRGNRRDTTLATKVLLLEALGCNVSSIPAAEASLRTRVEEAWRRWVSPFLVQRAERPTIDLFLPADRAGQTWSWEAHLETGETTCGTFRPAQLSLVGARVIDGTRIEHRRLEIDRPVAPGYHRFQLSLSETVESVLARVPAACYMPAALQACQRVWGISAHLYTLRSAKNWGIGDFGDLAALCELAGRAGASAVAVNPLHALFAERPNDASPYSPSSRAFLNPIYIDIDSAPFSWTLLQPEVPAETLSSLRNARLVDYENVWRAKRVAFEGLFHAFQTRGQSSDVAHAFSRFVMAGGETLLRFATFSALEEEFHAAWPLLRNHYPAPDAPAVVQFTHERADRILFHQYLQFLADRQLESAAKQVEHTGMEIGIIGDLAIGVSPDGFDVWEQPAHYATALRCGAPPDDFNSQGQEWGIVPLNPVLLRQHFEPFAALLRANMRHTGGLRIDHVIGLQRQFLVPLGGETSEGCYIRYPFEELLGILALESHRNTCLVIGEDLGTVPEGFRTRMHEENIFGCALLYFERLADGALRPPRDYRTGTVASVGTHDLPTLAGYWEGHDCIVRRDIGVYSEAEVEAALSERRRDCARLLSALKDVGLLVGDDSMGTLAWPIVRKAVHAFLASSAAQLFFAQLDDLLDETDQLNIPGTTVTYPNWRRKLSLGLEEAALTTGLHALAEICANAGRHRRSM